MQEQQVQDHLSKGASLPVPGQLTPEQMDKVDELADIKSQLAAVEPLSKKAEDLRKELLPVADLHFTNDQQAVLKGHSKVVIFSAKSETRAIEDLNGLIGILKDKIGYEALIAKLKLTLKDIDESLTPAESAPFLKKIVGTRTFKGYMDK